MINVRKKSFMIRGMPTYALILMAGMVSASDLPKWGDSGDWDIHIDPAAGNGCFMEKSYPDGSLVRFGRIPLKEGGFFSALNITWTQVQPGVENDVKFDFDGVRFSGKAVGIAEGLMQGGYVFFDDPNIAMEFAGKNTMTILGTREGDIVLPLKGTGAAVAKVRECQLMQPLPPKVEGAD